MISDAYSSRTNGLSTSIQTFPRQLNVLGHQVLLIAPDYGGGQDVEPGILRVPSAADARAYVQGWSGRRMAARMLAFYQQVAGREGRGLRPAKPRDAAFKVTRRFDNCLTVRCTDSE